jgi:MFS family permease
LVFISRIALYANFMVYAACLPILLNRWDMSATQAGSISSAFMFGYAASLFVFAWLSDYFGAKRLFLLSAVPERILSFDIRLFRPFLPHPGYYCMPLPQQHKVVFIRRQSCCSQNAMTHQDVARRSDT